MALDELRIVPARFAGTARPGKAFVYLLPHAAEPRFKIGFAVNPILRIRSLPEARSLDRGRIVAYETPDKRSAREIEYTLHFMFRSHRLPPVHSGSGSTKWFDIRALDAVKAWLESNRETLGWTNVDHVRPSKPPIRTKTDDAMRYLYDGPSHAVFRAMFELAGGLSRPTEAGIATIARIAALDLRTTYACMHGPKYVSVCTKRPSERYSEKRIFWCVIILVSSDSYDEEEAAVEYIAQVDLEKTRGQYAVFHYM